MTVAQTFRRLAWRVAGRAGKAAGGRVVRRAVRSMRPLKAFQASARNQDTLTVDAAILSRGDLITSAQQVLARHGIVVIKNLLSGQEVDAAARAADNLRATVSRHFDGSEMLGETPEFIWQNGFRKYKTWNALVNAPKPVALLRSSDDDEYDVGMLEFFHAGKLSADLNAPEIEHLLASPAYQVVSLVLEKKFTWSRTVDNLYINHAVKAPRGQHIDCLAPSYKSFLYLTDCLSLKDGPYRYVPGSQARADLLTAAGVVRMANGGRDDDFPELQEHSLPILGAAGTIIISAQFGVHGGHPQTDDGRRIMLVRNYTSLPAARP